MGAVSSLESLDPTHPDVVAADDLLREAFAEPVVLNRTDVVVLARNMRPVVLDPVAAIAALLQLGGPELVAEATGCLRDLKDDEVLCLALVPCAEGIRCFVGACPTRAMQPGGDA